MAGDLIFNESVVPNKFDRPTLNGVAERACVSVATVSRILNGVKNKAAKATKQRVLQAVSNLNYHPVRVGRALSKMRASLVALLVPNSTNAFYASIADTLQSAFNTAGNAIILCNTSEDPTIQDAYLQEMQSHLVLEFILLGAVESPGLERVLKDRPLVIFINRKCPYTIDSVFVVIDNYAAGFEVAEHFIDRGFQRCAVIHGPLNSSASRERFFGFRDGLKRASIVLDDDNILPADLDIELGYSQATMLFDNEVLSWAVFCGNDLIAYGASRRCRESGLRVPQDVALVWF